MKQIEKLNAIVNNPNNFGLRRNERVYKAICDLAIYGQAQTGYSDRQTYFVYTQQVFYKLKEVGISCKHMNIAPRGGASGERVYLTGAVLKAVKKNN